VSNIGGSYNESEAQEILRRAANLQTSGAMSRDEMIRAAAELGISPEAVELAEQQYQEARTEDELRSRFRSKRRQEFAEGFKVLAVCIVIWWLMEKDGIANLSFQHNAFAFVILGYGVWAMIKNAYFAYAEKSHAYQRSFEAFKVSEQKRSKKAVKYTNDRVIEDILLNTNPRQKLEVIKNLRENTGLPLNEAKNAVDDYYNRHPEIKQQA